MGTASDLISDLENRIEEIPLANEQKSLLIKVLKALYKPQEFGKEDLVELYEQAWSDKDFFDLLSYASEFTAKSKMIEVYLS